MQQLEPKAKDLSKTVADTYKQIQTVLETLAKPGRNRPSVPITDVVELVRGYAQWRFDDLLRQQLVTAYVTCAATGLIELREINYCRVRLTELHQAFAEACIRRKAKRPTRQRKGPVAHGIWFAGGRLGARVRPGRHGTI